jgi:serralysin
MQGNTATGAVTILQETNLAGGISRPPVAAANDFLGARSADILFQDSNSGTLTLWEMEGSFFRRTIQTGNPGAPWHVVGSGDFDGDGKAGILFRADNGAAAIWESLREPFDVTAGIALASFDTQGDLQNNGPSWHVKAVADFDGDARADIVWQNDNGAAAIWLMNGIQIRPDGHLNIAQNNGPTWHIAAARDMDSDGKADILWQNDNGAMAVWEDFSFTPSVGTANFATQLNMDPQPNAPGHADWHLL